MLDFIIKLLINEFRLSGILHWRHSYFIIESLFQVLITVIEVSILYIFNLTETIDKQKICIMLSRYLYAYVCIVHMTHIYIFSSSSHLIYIQTNHNITFFANCRKNTHKGQISCRLHRFSAT